ncbi:hypothetical protein HOI71_07745 [Candidatus Poribacteria bacterium]|nr:hypothetical protein [Candidatus Poribacteria bacterium]
MLDENGEVLSTVTTKKDGLLAAGEHWAFDIEASAVGAESHRRQYAGWQTLTKPVPSVRE